MLEGAKEEFKDIKLKGANPGSAAEKRAEMLILFPDPLRAKNGF
jgi:hypothetical protein